MTELQNKRKYYTIAFIIALIVGFITLLPQLLLQYDLGKNYKGIIITGTDAEEYYHIRVREAYDGHLKISSPDLFEYKIKPYAQAPLPEITMSIIGRTLGLSAPQMIAFSKFIFPFLLYIVFFLLLLEITKNKSVALLAPIMLMLAAQFVLNPNEMIKLLRF